MFEIFLNAFLLSGGVTIGGAILTLPAILRNTPSRRKRRKLLRKAVHTMFQQDLRESNYTRAFVKYLPNTIPVASLTSTEQQYIQNTYQELLEKYDMQKQRALTERHAVQALNARRDARKSAVSSLEQDELT